MRIGAVEALWCLAALAAAFATAYVRTLAEAAGAGPHYNGPMGKADRMLWLGVAATAGALGFAEVLRLLPVLIAVGGLLTIAIRLRNAHAAL